MPPVGVERRTKPEVLAFIALIEKADGQLIPLRKRTADGKKLYITARYIVKPEKKNQGLQNAFFWRFGYTQTLDAVLAIDVYMGEDTSTLTPLGHRDWAIEDSKASGAGNVHDAFIPKNKHEKLAQEKWIGDTAFKVEKDYQSQGVGTLMLATSAIVLPKMGVESFRIGALLAPAKSTYKRFGIEQGDFVINNEFVHLPMERLSQNPKVQEVISEFV